MTAFEGVSKLPPSSLVNFVSVLARNNFGDAELLLQVNHAILEKRKSFSEVEMTMLMGHLYELDRVTHDLDSVFKEQILQNMDV